MTSINLFSDFFSHSGVPGKTLKSGFAANKDSNEKTAQKPVPHEGEEKDKDLSKKSSSEDLKDTTQHSSNPSNQGNDSDKKIPKPQVKANSPVTKPVQNSNPEEKKTEVEKPAVKKPAMGGFAKGLLARLKEAAANENNQENEKNNVSDVNTSKQQLVGVKADHEKDNANHHDKNEPLSPPNLVRGESAKKSTFAKIVGKLAPKKTEKDAPQELKRVNSIKQKLLDEDTDITEIDDTFSKDKTKRFKQKLHLILYHPEVNKWVI
mgnify:CR=1 FL=1